MSDIDPNLWASLAKQYTGGINAPATGQAGYVAQVNADANNLEYVPEHADIFVTNTNETIGGMTYYHRQAQYSDDATHDLYNDYLPAGILHVRIFQSAICTDGGKLARCMKYLMWSDGATTLTSLALIDSDSGSTGSISSTFAAVSLSSGKLILQGNNVGSSDGNVLWTTTIEVTQHDVEVPAAP